MSVERDQKRNLDVASNASIDKVALNNKVVSMRTIVRRAKLYTINDMTKKMKKLRQKRGSEEQKQKNNSKADRLVEEMKIIKILKPDYVSKYALGCTEKLEQIVLKQDTTMELRALTRLVQNNFIQDIVTDFRAKHDDWKDLAAYLMTKHTSREFRKKKKTKEKMVKIEANAKVSETLVRKYLKEKLAGNSDIDNDLDIEHNIEHVQDSSVNKKESTSRKARDVDSKVNAVANHKQESIDIKKSRKLTTCATDLKSIPSSANLPHKRNVTKQIKPAVSDSDESSEKAEEEISDLEEIDCNTNMKLNQNSLKVCNQSDDEDEGENNDYANTISDTDNSESEVDDSYSAESGLSENDSDMNECKEDKFVTVLKKSRTAAKSDTCSVNTEMVRSVEGRVEEDTVKNLQQTMINVKEKVEGEIVVKKLCLSDVGDEIPQFLLQSSSTKSNPKKKHKDSFFITEANEGTDSENINHESDTINDDITYNEYSENKERQQGGRCLLGTTFVSSLESGKMMVCNDAQYRTKEEWIKLRHEKREQNMRGGRGHSDFPRSFQGGRGGSSDWGRGQRGGRGRGGGRGHDWKQKDEHSVLKVGRGRQEAHMGQDGKSSVKEQTVHPSWEASKKRKQEQAGALHAFSGKKIKFDD